MSSKFIDAHEAARWVASGDTCNRRDDAYRRGGVHFKRHRSALSDRGRTA